VDESAPYTGLFDGHLLLGEPVILRDLRICPLNIQPVVVREGGLQVLTRAVIRLEYGQPGGESVDGNALPATGHGWSFAMEEIYRGLVPNHGQFYDQVDDTVFPVYYIVGADAYLNLSNIGELVSWKRRKGYDVRVVPFSTMPGGTANTIAYADLKAWVDGVWDSARPEMLLLVGDVDGTWPCPSTFVVSIEGDHDVTDHDLALQEGTDYLPEFLVGRLSVDNPQQLFTVARKPVVHESQTPVGQGDCEWHKHGLIVSCNYADNGQAPISPNLTSRWLIDKMRANGWCLNTQADSLFYPPLSDGSTPIGNAINEGRGVISYRGWANSNGWVFPAYDRDDISELSNGFRMPIVASFVCQTGAFGGEATVLDPCFGEKFLQFGSPASLGGAVAFVGPSDLHTRTQFNNPVCSGFFNATFDLGLNSVGAALLNGKLELYRGYPLTRNDPYEAFFYFHVYNVLGDPDLKIWRDTPLTLGHDAPAQIAAGAQVLDLRVEGADGQPLGDAVVTVTGGATSSSLVARGRTGADGRVLLQLDPGALTSLVLTINHTDYLPGGRTIGVGAAVEGVQLSSMAVTEELVDGVYRAGETLTLLPTARNTGSATLATLAATLQADEALFEVLDGSVSWNSLAGGASAGSQDALQIRLNHDLPDGQGVPLVLEFNGDAQATGVYTLETRNKAVSVTNATLASGADHLEPAIPDTLVIELTVAGVTGLRGASAHLSTESGLISLLDPQPRALGDLDLQATATVSFPVVGGAQLFPGRLVYLTLEMEDADGYLQHVQVPLPNGSEQTDSPTGPDMYGYYALESGDFGLVRRPVYDWQELDPVYGGHNDTRLMLLDDQVTLIDLPFPVTYYGRTFSELSVCSNGWVSMGRTWMSDFSNWNIPSALGPSDMICAWWDDLKPRYSVAGDSIHVPVFIRHDAADGRFIISWSRTYARYAWENAGQPLQEFQLIFHDPAGRPTPTGDTEFTMQYKTVTNVDLNNNYATVGITNFEHNDGIEITYANQASGSTVVPGAGSAILYTTRPPENNLEIQLDVTRPVNQQWLIPGGQQIRWNHSLLRAVMAATSVEYNIQVLGSGGQLLLDTGGQGIPLVDTDVFDLASLETPLPEGVPLTLRITAIASTSGGAVPVTSLQGDVIFYQDLTAPGLTLAVENNDLFVDLLELAVFTSEAMGSLAAFGLDAQGAVLGGFETLPGERFVQGNRELYYLQAVLSDALHHIRIEGQDSHGLPVQQDLALAQAPGSAGGLELPERGLDLAWSPVSGVVRLLELGAFEMDDRAAGAFWLQLPTGLESARLDLAVDGQAVLARREGGRWLATPQQQQAGRLVATLEQGGVYALLPADAVSERPARFHLHANWPNPFNPETRLAFDLPEAANTRLVIYNLLGEQVRVLQDGPLAAGSHHTVWDGRGQSGQALASGMYLARLEAGPHAATRKMLLVR
jgi:hypothetical protein